MIEFGKFDESKTTVETALDGTASRVIIADAALLFQGTYARQHSDLIISGPGENVVRLLGYFDVEHPSDLYSSSGAVLTSDVVIRLAGAQNPNVFAQTGFPADQLPIGQVETLEGAAFSTRANGQRVSLNVGDPVFEDDLIETADESSLGITFVDETVFSLSANARMILDELVYEPGGGENAMVINLVQGTFVFITGQVAPTGEMVVETPVATMGIRGTSPIIVVEGQNGTTEFGILKDPDGSVGNYVIRDKATGLVLARVADEGTIFQLDRVDGNPLPVTLDAGKLAERAEAQSNAYFLYTVARSRIDSQQRDSNGNENQDEAPPEGVDPTITDSIDEALNLDLGTFSGFALTIEKNTGDDQTVISGTGSSGASEGRNGDTAGGSPFGLQSNAPPVASDQTFQFSEDVQVGKGNVIASDPDGAGDLTFTITRQPEFGVVLVNADATFTFVADPIFNTLSEGEVTSVSFSYQATDASGAISNAATVTLQIIGINDVPIASHIDSGTVSESAGLVSIDLLATALDPDSGDDLETQDLTVSSSDPSRRVTFEIDHESGRITIDPAQFENLPENASETLTVGYSIVDRFGGLTSNTAVLTINGQNSLPLIDGDTAGAAVEDLELAVSGNLTVRDVDTGESGVQPETRIGTFGTFTIASSGAWDYALANDNEVVQALPAGATLVETLTVSSLDGTATATVTIAITGTNDVPTLAGEVSGSVVEDSSLTASGSLIVTDIDTGESAVEAQGNTVGAFGTFSINGNGSWTYILDNENETVQSLRANETVREMFPVSPIDGSLTESVIITIVGENDVPTISGDVSGSVVEDSRLIASGNLVVTDIDADESAVQAQGGTNGAYGTFSISTSGSWTYILDNENETVQSLRANETVREMFPVSSIDGSLTESVIITIVGENDVPTVSGDLSGSVTEDTSLTATGMLLTSGQDTGVGSFEAQTSFGAFGTFSVSQFGDWTYVLNNESEAVQALDSGQSLSESFLVKSSDGLANETVNIVINGRDETVPEIVGDVTGAVVEDLTLTSSGFLTVADPDAVENSVQANTETGAFGTFSIASSGMWTYTLDNAADAVQELPANKSVDDIFLVKSADETASRIVSITLTGVNDPATIGGQLTADVARDTSPTVSGVLTVADRDYGESAVQQQTAVAGTFGTFSITASGAWEYTLADVNEAAQIGIEGLPQTDRFLVTSVDGSASDFVTVTIVEDADVGASDGFWGKSLEYQYLFPNQGVEFAGDAQLPIASATFTIDGEVEFFNNGVSADFSIDLDDKTISMTFLTPANFTVSEFNGFRLSDVSDNVLEITGVSDDSQMVTTSFDENNVFVNLSGANFTAGQSFAIDVEFGTNGKDPIFLDVNGDGIGFSAGGDAVSFDLTADGSPEYLSWGDGLTGMLVMDLDGSGQIEDGTEVFSPWFGEGGFDDAIAALAMLDSNFDGVLDRSDPDFEAMGVWIDEDIDANTDSGELQSLTFHGINAIDLNADYVERDIDGQSVIFEGAFTLDNGEFRDYVGVVLDTAGPLETFLAEFTGAGVSQTELSEAPDPGVLSAIPRDLISILAGQFPASTDATELAVFDLSDVFGPSAGRAPIRDASAIETAHATPHEDFGDSGATGSRTIDLFLEDTLNVGLS